jgi:hypothetical protein
MFVCSSSKTAKSPMFRRRRAPLSHEVGLLVLKAHKKSAMACLVFFSSATRANLRYLEKSTIPLRNESESPASKAT